MTSHLRSLFVVIITAAACGPVSLDDEQPAQSRQALVACTTDAMCAMPMLAAGSRHALVLRADGTISAAGDNLLGQLGTGEWTLTTGPMPVVNLDEVTAVAAGNRHSLALKSDGSVWAWGQNSSRELGTTAVSSSHTPLPVAGLSPAVVAIAGGYDHSLALQSDGTVMAWGALNADNRGQLGHGSTTGSATPVLVAGHTGFTAIAAGNYLSMGLKSDGTVWTWGFNLWGQLGNGANGAGTNSSTPVQVTGLTGVVAIAAGWYHALALKSDGTVSAWGNGGGGTLGNGSTANANTPVTVTGLTDIIAVSAGSGHSLALKRDGTVWAWGFNSEGELGTGTSTNELTPVQVVGLTGVIAISAGHSDTIDPAFSMAMKSDGSVAGWGANSYGQWGSGTASVHRTPVALSMPGSVTGIASGSGGAHTLALTGDTVVAWGNNNAGQLGNGNTTTANVYTTVTGLSSVAQIAGGSSHSLACLEDGAVFTWGNNQQGQLGNGTTTNSPVPLEVPGLTGVVSVAGGLQFSLALKDDGTVVAWGNNQQGQLGDGTTTNSLTPVAVTGLTGVTAIAAGDEFALALKGDGTVVSWGRNQAGQLGNGTLVNSSIPVEVGGLTGVTQIAAGLSHSLALKADGTVVSWGLNSSGQLGRGNMTNSSSPVAVNSLTGVAAIASGRTHSIAVMSDGTIATWGSNQYGALGDGLQPNRLTPGPVAGLTGVVAATGGWGHTVAMLSDGTLVAWGANRVIANNYASIGNGWAYIMLEARTSRFAYSGSGCGAAPSCVSGACVTTSCSRRGTCVADACVCAPEFNGATCNACTNGADNYPLCYTPSAECDPATTCSGHGVCNESTCVCDSGYSLPACTDQTAPVLTLPGNAVLEAVGPTGAPHTFAATATDFLDGPRAVTCIPSTGATFPLGETAVTCVSLDSKGNLATGGFTVTVLDSTPPVVDVPGTQSVEAISADGAVVVFTVSSADVVDGAQPASCTPPSGSLFPLGDTLVDCLAVDAAGNPAGGNFTVSVSDTTPPVLMLPGNLSIAGAPATGAVVTFTASAHDAVSGAVPVNCTPSSGSVFPAGDTVVSCSASDALNQTANGSFTVNVTTAAGPATFSLPPNATIEATAATGATHTFTATATDSVDGSALTVDCTPSSGSTFPLGTTHVFCTATDSTGGTASGAFTVTVEDTIDPVLTLPGNFGVDATGPAGAIAVFTATANDTVSGALPVNCAPASGSTFPLGDTLVNCTASDVAGNSASGSFTLTVRNNTPPVIFVPGDLTLDATTPEGAVFSFIVTATDEVDGDVPVDCTPASGSFFPVGGTLVSCTATDAANNTSIETFSVTVRASTAPLLSLPSALMEEATSGTGAAVTFTATAMDAEDGAVPVSCTPASGSTFQLGLTAVVCQATDSSAKTSTGVFTVTVVDTTAPVLTVPEAQTVEATSANGAQAYFTVTATDAVSGALSGACTPASGSTFPLGVTQVSCLATDTSGNDTDGKFNVIVRDTTPPVLALPGALTVETREAGGAPVSFSARAHDIVSGDVEVTCTPASGSTFALGENTVTCSATDATGNSGEGTFVITVSPSADADDRLLKLGDDRLAACGCSATEGPLALIVLALLALRRQPRARRLAVCLALCLPALVFAQEKPAEAAPTTSSMRAGIFSKLQYDQEYFTAILAQQQQGRRDTRLSADTWAREVKRAKNNVPVLKKLFSERKAFDEKGAPFSLPPRDDVHRVYSNLITMLNMLQAYDRGDWPRVVQAGERVVVSTKEDFGLVKSDDAKYYLNLYREYFWFMAAAHYRLGNDREAIAWLSRMDTDVNVAELKKQVASIDTRSQDERLAALFSRSVAVLRPVQLRGEGETKWLEGGLMEVMTTDLQRYTSLTITERANLDKVVNEIQLSQAGLTDEKNAKKLATQLMAGTLLTGGYEVKGGEATLSLELLDGDSGTSLGRASGGFQVHAPFGGAREVLVALLRDVGWLSSDAAQELTEARTPSADSIRALLEARLQVAGNAAQARALYEKAVKEDPEYANAFLELKERFEGVMPLVAVMSFVNVSGREADEWMRFAAAEAMQTDLPAAGFTLVERTQLAKVLKEEMLGKLDEGSATALAKKASADFVVLGSVMNTGRDTRVDCRFVDVSTGVVVQSFEATGATADYPKTLATLLAAIARRFNTKLSEAQLKELSGNKLSRDELERISREKLLSEQLTRKEAAAQQSAGTVAPVVLSAVAVAAGTTAAIAGFLVAGKTQADIGYFEGLLSSAATADGQAALNQQLDALRTQHGVWLGVGIGGAAIAAGASAILAWQAAKYGQQSAVHVVPVVGPGTIGVAGSF